MQLKWLLDHSQRLACLWSVWSSKHFILTRERLSAYRVACLTLLDTDSRSPVVALHTVTWPRPDSKSFVACKLHAWTGWGPQSLTRAASRVKSIPETYQPCVRLLWEADSSDLHLLRLFRRFTFEFPKLVLWRALWPALEHRRLIYAPLRMRRRILSHRLDRYGLRLGLDRSFWILPVLFLLLARTFEERASA